MIWRSYKLLTAVSFLLDDDNFYPFLVILRSTRKWLNWIEHRSSNPQVVGSSPTFRIEIMKKSFWILASVVIVLLGAAYFLYPRASFGGVQMSEKQFKQVNRSKDNIDVLLQDLNKYKPTSPKTVTKIKQDVDQLIAQNGENLSTADFDKLETAAGDKNGGVLATIEAAQKGHYLIDGDIASVLHTKFSIIVLQSAKSATESDSQAKKVASQIEKDLSIDSRLYKIGIKS